ncbi:aldolase/citrate lyase family protein [Xanthobacteraceae bacterium Astr-EGSB]|uniref:HpcH/HpaI aldolase family protein n=1 Tax=Astrobacterium formosum TaxID=3069710 RepID=UPI0027B5E52F|nr:aldolase/citrate lyase family protein [Xanthobacteraceae bacterium Astr-EGSB]
MRNRIQSLLASGEPFIGSTLMLGSTRAAEIMSRAGFDFLMVDQQHGPFDKAGATDAIRALAPSPTVPFARVAENSPGRINDVLDAGALGVVVPMVNSAREAEAAVKAAFYPPRGQRSKGGAATAIHGDDYATWANDHVLLMVMIETSEAVEHADEILAVPGIDLCLVGTSDLSFEMGCGRTAEPIGAAIAATISAGRAHGVAVGTAIGSPEDIAKWRSLEPAFYLISHDHGLLTAGSRSLVTNLRQRLAETR